MHNSQPRKHQTATIPRSPQLFRSRSGSSTALFLDEDASTKNSGLKRANSSTKTRTLRGQENVLSPCTKTSTKKKLGEDNTDDGFVKFVSGSKSKIEVPRRTRSASTSPSAWALSPGRSMSYSSPAPPVPTVPKSPNMEKLKKEVSGVLKYFKQKKVSSALEEQYHLYRVMYNRLLQWRFANARAEASMAVVKRISEKRLFSVWFRVSLMRNFISERRIQLQSLKQELKVYQTVTWQLSLLREWSRIEAKNHEAVGRVARKLSAISTCLPLVQDVKGDTMSVYDAMSVAIQVMDSIQATIIGMYYQVEKTCYFLKELILMLKQQKDYFQELEKKITAISLLEVQENSLRVHNIQLAEEMQMVELLT